MSPGSRHRRVTATAEGLQFTTAQGPCREAWSTQQPVIADEMALAARWPLFYDELVALSPFRAMVAIPLRHGLGRSGTLNLLLRSDVGFTDLNLHDVHAVNEVISQALLVALTTADDGSPGGWAGGATAGPEWVDGPDTARRSAVHVAIGMLAAALEISGDNALALLRARAFTTGHTVDDIAAALTELRLNTTDLDPYNTD